MDTTQPVRLTIRPARQTHLTHGFCGQFADIWPNSVGGKRLINSTFSWLDAVQCVASCQIIVVNLDCKIFINTSWRQIGASRKYSTSLFSHWIILISRTNSSQFGLSVKSWKKPIDNAIHLKKMKYFGIALLYNTLLSVTVSDVRNRHARRSTE